MNKKIKILLEVIISILITLFIFYICSWYSFNTLPTKSVFIRMIIVVLIIFDLIELSRYKCKKYKRLDMRLSK